MQNDTSLDFNFGSKAMHIPIKWVGKDSAETDSPETRLLPDQRELQERNKQYCTSEVAHSGKSFSLTAFSQSITVQPLPSTRYFLI